MYGFKRIWTTFEEVVVILCTRMNLWDMRMAASAFSFLAIYNYTILFSVTSTKILLSYIAPQFIASSNLFKKEKSIKELSEHYYLVYALFSSLTLFLFYKGHHSLSTLFFLFFFIYYSFHYRTMHWEYYHIVIVGSLML